MIRLRVALVISVTFPLLLAVSCDRYPSYPEFVRVARVEGEPQRYTLREMVGFPPAAEVVHPTAACNGPGKSVHDWQEQFTSTFFYPIPNHREQGPPPDSLVLEAACGSVYGDTSRDRCYQFTIDGVNPIPVTCNPDWRSTMINPDPEQYKGGTTRKYRDQLPDAGLELVISDTSVPGASWGGGFFGGGVKGPFTSYLEVFDLRQQRDRIFFLTTTKGIWGLQTAWFAVGKRARIVTLLSRTHTVVIDIHPARGE